MASLDLFNDIGLQKVPPRGDAPTYISDIRGSRGRVLDYIFTAPQVCQRVKDLVISTEFDLPSDHNQLDLGLDWQPCGPTQPRRTGRRQHMRE